MALRIVLLATIVVLVTGCAGMDPQLQKNYGINALIGAGIGGAVGAGISAITGGNPATGAVIGGIAGAGLWAANTPVPSYGQPYPQPVYGYDVPSCQFGGRVINGQLYCPPSPPPCRMDMYGNCW